MNKQVISFYVRTNGNVVQQVGRSYITQPATVKNLVEKKRGQHHDKLLQEQNH